MVSLKYGEFEDNERPTAVELPQKKLLQRARMEVTETLKGLRDELSSRELLGSLAAPLKTAIEAAQEAESTDAVLDVETRAVQDIREHLADDELFEEIYATLNPQE